MKIFFMYVCTSVLSIFLFTQFTYCQPSQIHLDFEDLSEFDLLGGVSTGTIEQTPGLDGNALSLVNATSVCFPAQTFINEVQGTLQFWIKDIEPNGGLWEVTQIGTNKLWGAFKFSDETTDQLHYELQTAASTSARSSRNWPSSSDWHFVVFTWQQGTVRTEFAIYLDAFTGSKPNLLGKIQLSTDSQLCLGKYSNKGSSHPIIDELSTFNYVRNSTQIFDDFLFYFTGCPSWPYIWRNPLNGADVNRNGMLEKYDILHILSAIASGDQFDFLSCPDGSLPQFSYDVFADNLLTFQDALTALTAVNNTLPDDQKLNMSTLSLITHGDANEDGILNGLDIQIILQNQSQTFAIFTNGDITGDGLVDQKDLTVARKYISTEGDYSSILPRFKVQRAFTSQ